MEKRTHLSKIKTFFSKKPRKAWIIGGIIGAVVISYGVIFFIPKTIQFSYAEKSCAGQLVIAPDLQKINSPDFEATLTDTVRVANVNLFSTKVCVEPKTTPRAGAFAATISPFGGFVASKKIVVNVPEAPVARSSDIVGKTISASKPLKIKLTAPDVVHQYTLKVADKEGECTQASAELSCDVAALGLAHGAAYTASLHQTYKGEDKKVLEGKLETLQPLGMTASSVANSQTIFDKPTALSLTFDQPIENGEIKLVKLVGEATEEVPTTQKAEGATLTVAFKELPRESTYRLEVAQATGKNGSSLAAPVSITFATSGGPKVTSVSVGANSVSRTARIIVTFDQPIDASIDMAKIARAEGVAAAVKKQSDTQLSFAIQGGDCTAFNLIIDKGIKSASNGETSKDAWKFSSRTICGYSWNIGASVKGRAITAHSFGSGSSVLLFTGGMHGSEPSGYTTMQAFAQYLQANGDIVPAGKRVVIVPNTSPDGIAAGSRNNSRNVNIDRNFPTKNWKAAIETSSGVLPTGGGTSAGSEPETAALMALTRQLRPRLEVSFHAKGSLVGANKFGDSVAIGNIYAKTVGYKTMYYDAEAVMGYPMTGEYEDWMGEEMNIPAILIELPGASGNYFNAQLNALKKMLAV